MAGKNYLLDTSTAVTDMHWFAIVHVAGKDEPFQLTVEVTVTNGPLSPEISTFLRYFVCLPEAVV